MNPVNSEKSNYWRGVGLGTLLMVLLEVGGYFLSRGDRNTFGPVMFLLVPFVSGFAVAAVVRKPKRVTACCVMGCIISMQFLLFFKLEGIICCLMAAPVAAAGVAIGAWIGYRVRGKFIDRMDDPGKTTALLLLLSPLLIAAADKVEQPYRAQMEHETFATEITVNASPERAWNLIAKMDKLDGERPFLIRAGLPTPQRCTLDKEGVGGKRVCYFDQGIIAQEVTAWQKPSLLGVRITESTLPGRHWLTFIDASYELIPEGENKTRVIRKSTIGTKLYPRWYWRPFERWGVTSEHDFLFDNLRRWVDGK